MLQGVSQPDGTTYIAEFPISLKFPKGQKSKSKIKTYSRLRFNVLG